jgi:protein-S-isoprenylcysteine O-methyltransferase Ste14
MNRIIKFIVVILGILALEPVFGQEKVPMADNLRAEGKIYVVVIMILIVLVGLILYLFLMDRNVKKLEKLVSEKKKQTN